MGKKLGAAMAATLTCAGVLLPAPSAEARQGCVTRAEFRNTHDGTTLLNQERKYETHGRLLAQGGGYKDKSYKACYGPDTARVHVTYRHHDDAWRVAWKLYLADPGD